jgi:chemotaxis protein histidine kinase CheA
MHFQEKDASFSTRYYEFQFRRIYKGEAVDRIFVSIRDITTQVELTKRLKDSEERKERQFSLLLDLVNVPAADVDAFCSHTSASLDQVNNLLKAEDFIVSGGREVQDKDLRDRVNGVFRHIHSIKGQAAALGIAFFVKQAHAFEDALTRIKNRPKLSGEDFLGIIANLSEMKTSVAECLELREKLGSGPAAGRTSGQSPQAGGRTPLAEVCRRLVADLSSSTGRAALFDYAAERPELEQGNIRSLLEEILPQLIRNSFAHGIEPAAARVQAGKPEKASIQIRLGRAKNGATRIEYREDGRGLDGDKIKQKSIALGLISPEDAARKDERAFWAYIFEPGFSTSEQGADLVSGRGVGLDLVRDAVMVRSGGQIFVDSQPGEFVHFTFEIPS